MIAISDSWSDDESRAGDLSKKERVLRLAQTDPFLSVDEIANMVGTTSRYVRTSLSEAGLTLTELRRRFAEDMRKRLKEAGAERTRRGTTPDSGNTKAAVEGGARERTYYMRVGQLVDAQAASLLGTEPDTPLLQVSRLRLLDGQPLYINVLVTTEQLTVNEQLLTGDGPMYNLLDQVLAGKARPMVDRRTVDIVPASKSFAESLGVKLGHPLLRSGTLITTSPGNEPIAIEFNYFDAMSVRLELETASRRAMRVIERESGV